MQVTFELLKKQNELFKMKTKYILFGGSKGGGKTVGISFLALKLINEYPGSRIGIFRKNLSSLKRTTLKTFISIEQQLPEVIRGRLNSSSLEYHHPNGSEIVFMSADPAKDPNFEKLRGIELTGFIIDEASEIVEQAFDELKSCLRKRLKNGKEPNYFGICTSNPHQGWLKQRFIDKRSVSDDYDPSEYSFIPSLPSENSKLPKSYIRILKTLPEKLRRLYWEGDWSVQDEVDALFKYEWFELADKIPYEPGIKKLGVDVARYGDDETCIVYMEGNYVREIYTYHKTSTVDVVKRVKRFIFEKGVEPENVAIDEVGVGGGVVDQLLDAQYNVKGVNSGRSPIYNDFESEDSLIYYFFNLRSQLYWWLRESLEKMEIKIDLKERKLLDDLLAIKWQLRGDRVIQIEGKSEIKKRTGRSPDYADALCLAWNVNKINFVGRAKAFFVE